MYVTVIMFFKSEKIFTVVISKKNIFLCKKSTFVEYSILSTLNLATPCDFSFWKLITIFNSVAFSFLLKTKFDLKSQFKDPFL